LSQLVYFIIIIIVGSHGNKERKMDCAYLTLCHELVRIIKRKMQTHSESLKQVGLWPKVCCWPESYKEGGLAFLMRGGWRHNKKRSEVSPFW